MKKVLLLLLILLLLLTIMPEFVLAAKPRLRPAGGGSAGSGFSAVRLRGDRRAALISLYNLSRFQDISYSLTYLANGVEQGVQGSVNPAGVSTASRELLFGTCSKNVCTYHYSIQNMRLVLTGTTKTGQTIVKRYLIKV